MAANAKTCSPFYNKNNKIVVKLNDNALAEEMKKQAPKKVAQRIDAYFIENNITTTKFCEAQTLLNGDVAIQTTTEEKAKKLKGGDNWTKVLGSKAKLAQKKYGIVAMGIPIAKNCLKKIEEIKKKIVTQNASICMRMKIGGIFWLSTLKKNKRTFSLIIEINDAKMADTLIKKKPVLNHTLHGCMMYNLAYKIK